MVAVFNDKGYGKGGPMFKVPIEHTAVQDQLMNKLLSGANKCTI